MAQRTDQVEVYLEIGKTRAFAGAVDWPGWCRSGRDEASALQALVDYGPRYARVLQTTPLGFRAPSGVPALVVVERLEGNATTDFGAPGQPLTRDSDPVDAAGLVRWQAILQACWQALDAAVEAAAGKELRKGPRGGGRDLSKIVDHVREAEVAYLASLGGSLKPGEQNRTLAAVREAILATLAAAVRGEIPARGPRGGARWAPRTFVRRVAWHDLDHAWEIEDRAG